MMPSQCITTSSSSTPSRWTTNILLSMLVLTTTWSSLSPSCQSSRMLVSADNNYNYYNNNNNYNNNGDDGNYNNNNNNQNNYYNNNNYNNQNYYNDDGNNNGGDDYYDDDGGNNNNYNNYNNNGDDGYGNNNDDDANNGAADDDYFAVNDDGEGDDYFRYEDDWAANNLGGDDDVFRWDSNYGFDGVSVMPVSCINYNNGHMIKFELFDTENSYTCHFAQIGTFVVSIAHYMRAYFNHQALVNGQDFSLPSDAGYLNCVMLQETQNDEVQLYAKIGCMERETFTSTKLSLHVYTDAQCSVSYDDGLSARRHSTKGYDINGYTFPTRVSFKPPFYACQTCTPDSISETFNKKSGTWYDDDYISQYGSKQGNNDNEDGDDEDDEDEDNDDGGADDYYQDDYNNVDDAYMAANDDVNNYNNDDGGNNYYYNYQNYNANNQKQRNYNYGDDDYYGADDDDGNGGRKQRILKAAPGQLEKFEKEFWEEAKKTRELYDNFYDVGNWNMCQRVYKYGIWCDDECRALDAFRTDRWSGADVILLSIMCTFLTAMMLLIVAKRLKASQKSRIYGEDSITMPGLPPVAMGIIFGAVMTIIIVMAKLKFVNETLVFAVVTCILLFIYMLKLTLFDNRRPVLLAAPRHEAFDNPLDERLFD